MTRNTHERWGSISIGFHWAIAGLVLAVQVPAGLIMTRLDQGPAQNFFYDVHKMTGLTVFVLAVARLAWRLSNPVPQLPATLPHWQAIAARVNHALLYVFIFLMPISGFIYTAAGGFPVPLFYLYDLASLVPESKPVADAAKAVHLTAVWGLAALVALHVAAAAYHHFVRRDGILRRMISPSAIGRSCA